MRKVLLTLALCVALAALVGAAFAQAAPAPTTAAPAVASPVTPPPHFRMEILRPAPCILPTLRLINPQMVQIMSVSLSLTDDQKTKLTALLDSSDKVLKPKIEAQVKAGQDYVAQLTKIGATQAELAAAADKAMKAETDVMMAKIETLFAVRGLLTPDQNEQLSKRLAQYMRPWWGGMEAPGPPMPGRALAPAPAK